MLPRGGRSGGWWRGSTHVGSKQEMTEQSHQGGKDWAGIWCFCRQEGETGEKRTQGQRKDLEPEGHSSVPFSVVLNFAENRGRQPARESRTLCADQAPRPCRALFHGRVFLSDFRVNLFIWPLGKGREVLFYESRTNSKTIAHLCALIFLFTEIYFLLLYLTAVNKQIDGRVQLSQHKMVCVLCAHGWESFFFFYDIHYLKLAALISKSNTHHSPDTYEEAQSIWGCRWWPHMRVWLPLGGDIRESNVWGGFSGGSRTWADKVSVCAQKDELCECSRVWHTGGYHRQGVTWCHCLSPQVHEKV